MSAGEPYYLPGCTSSATCVLPNAMVPTRAWSSPAQKLLQYIPTPNSGDGAFSTGAFPQTVRDDKGSFRVDGNSRLGLLSGYYFVDDYRLDNPYPGAQGGASVPGFDALTIGRAQLFAAGSNKVFGSGLVNEFHFSLMRNVNNIGTPKGGLGVPIASQGFVTGPGTPGIVVQAPQFEGVENVAFEKFVFGVTTTNVNQVNNTLPLERQRLEGHGRAHAASGRRVPVRAGRHRSQRAVQRDLLVPGHGDRVGFRRLPARRAERLHSGGRHAVLHPQQIRRRVRTG